MKESESCACRRDRVATGRRHPSLHRDVRCLACPGDKHTTHSPSRNRIYTEQMPKLPVFRYIDKMRHYPCDRCFLSS